MGLLTKITLGLAVIVGGVAIAVPTIYKTKINDVLVKNQSKLEREGMIVSLLNDNDNFFNVNRDYTIQIKDSSYILNYMGLQAGSKEFIDIKTYLDETQFLLSFNLPKYPSEEIDHVLVSLDEFSPKVKDILNKKKLGEDFNHFVKNRGILVDFTFNQYVLKQVKLKDVDLTLKENTNILTNKISNFVINFDTMDKFKINLDQFKFNFMQKGEQVNFELDSYTHKVDKIDNFNAQENMNVQNILFELSNDNLPSQSAMFSLSDIKTNTSITSEDNKVLALSDMYVKTIKLNSHKDNIELGDFYTKVSVKDINKEIIDNLYTTLQNGGVLDQSKLTEYIQEFVSSGFNFNLDKFEIGYSKVNVNNNKFDTGKISLHSNVTLKENDINITDRPLLDLLAVLTSNLNIEMSKQDILVIMEQFKVSPIFMQFVKIENDKANIDAEFKNKELYVNKKRVL
ncbi:MAG: hypothetical protein HRT43_10155 [Campylobacteraceae bacterium]|nr:hypothetical protein [Campylobacteraceae bacterium]